MHKPLPSMAPRQGAMKRRDWAILLILSVLWGGSFFFIEIAIRDAKPSPWCSFG